MAIQTTANFVHKQFVEYFPVVTKDHVFAATYAVTTVALTALSYYAPISFFLAGGPLALVHIVIFNTAIQKSDASFLKGWMITACIVASAYMTVQISYFIPFLSWGVQATTTLRLSTALFDFAFFTGSIGFGGVLAKQFYQRGLELFKTEKWTAMEDHLTHHKHKVSSIWDKCEFAIGLFDPETIARIASSKMKAIFLRFTPEEKKEHVLAQLFQHYQSIAGIVPEEARELYPDMLSIVKSLPVQRQVALIPQLRQINPRALNDLALETREAYQAKVQGIQDRHPGLYAESSLARDALYARIDAIRNPREEKNAVEAISRDLGTLRQTVLTHISDVKHYAPDLQLRELNQLHQQLMAGEKVQQLQRLLSQANADESDFDETDQTWNYFLMNDTSGHDNAGMAFIQGWFPKFNVSDVNGLDEKLTEMSIGTIGEFVTNVLGGDRELLKNPDEVLRRLDDFISTKNDTRGKMYAYFAGQAVTQGSVAMQLFGKAAYKSAMILTAVAPIIIYPKLTAMGMLIGLAYHSVPAVTRKINDLLENEFLEAVVTKYRFIYTLATRRPFISLLSTNATGEMVTFQNGDILGKMRILSIEFFLGVILLNASFDQRGQLRGVGGIATGLAMGREVSQLAGRASRRVRA
jgi:hypothetical protein